mgnify:CR=1 FL=1
MFGEYEDTIIRVASFFVLTRFFSHTIIGYIVSIYTPLFIAYHKLKEFFPMKDRHARQVNLGEESNHEALNTIRHNENKNLVLAHDVEEIGDEP